MNRFFSLLFVLMLAIFIAPIHATEAIYCFGGAHIDNIFVLSNPPNLGGTNHAELKNSIGGVAYNMAHILKRKQNDVVMIGIVGQDLAGEMVLQTLNSEGIDNTNIIRFPDIPTPVFSGFYNTDGSLEIAAIEVGLYKNFHSDMLKDKMPELVKTKAWILDSSFEPEVYAYLASIKNKPKIYMTICSTVGIQNILPILSRTDVLFGNKEELSFFADSKDQTDAGIWRSLAIVAKKGVKTIICTDGPNGIYVLSNGKQYRMSAIPIKIVESTNGAGDALAAGVINALIKDQHLEIALKEGLETAAALLAKTEF